MAVTYLQTFSTENDPAPASVTLTPDAGILHDYGSLKDMSQGAQAHLVASTQKLRPLVAVVIISNALFCVLLALAMTIGPPSSVANNSGYEKVSW